MRAIVFLLFISTGFSQDCILDLSDPESPFIVDFIDLDFPKYYVNESVSIKDGGIFYIACPKGTKSTLLSSESGDEAACKKGTILNIDTFETVDFANIKCKSQSPTTVKKSDQKCADNRGTIYEIGFDVYLDFLSMITICFDEEKLAPIYCKYGNEYHDTPVRSNSTYDLFVCNDGADCGWTDSGKVYGTMEVDKIYDNQEEIFKNLGVNVSLPLVRSPLATPVWHLNVANNGQQIQKTPYYDYINVVPVWESDLFNELLYVLDLAIGDNTGYYMSSTIWTGTLEVANLPDGDGKQVEIYLSDDKVPVPKWIWMNWDNRKQIFFFYNHPNSEESVKAIADVCSQHNNLTKSMFTCGYESIINSQMKQLIDNDFK